MLGTFALVGSLAAALAACSVNSSTPTALADIQTPRVSIQTANDPSGIYFPLALASMIEVRIDDGDCVRIAEDVTASVNGMPLGSVGRGGWEESGIDSQCTAAGFSFVAPTFTATSHLVIADTTATWTIDASKLFANDLALTTTPGSPAQVTWASATALKLADAQLADANGALLWSTFHYDDVVPRATLSVAGNGFSLSAPVPTNGTRTLSVTATRTGSADRCEGPASCTVEVRAGREFPLD